MWMNRYYIPGIRWATLCAACMYITTIAIIMVLAMTNTILKTITMGLLLMLTMHVGMATKMITRYYTSYTVQTVLKDFFQRMKSTNSLDILLTKNTKKVLDEQTRK